MNLKKKVASTALLAVSLLSFSVPALARPKLGNDDWRYGCNNNPINWGSYSKYLHRTRFHWSNVIRRRDGLKRSAENHAGYWCEAFVNTRVGEYVWFDAGLYNG